MMGSIQDMARRLLAVLPQSWFASAAPILTAILNGFGAALSAAYALIAAVITQSRILTATGSFLDLISGDFFGNALLRWPGEQDNAFRLRICQALLRPRGTRAALIVAIQQLTGQSPVIFEPARSSDTGGYRVGGVGYGVAGGWGNLSLPFQFFTTIFRPQGGGIAQLAGYGTGGLVVYGNLAMEIVQLTDADLYAAVPPLLPAGTLAWCRITG